MTKILSFLLLTAALYAQSSSKVTIIPRQNDSETGVVDFRELYQNGSNYVGWRAPASIASSFRLTLPSALPVSTSATCLKIGLSGVMSTGTCTAGADPADYAWSQTVTAPGTAGTKTITLTPGPLGVSASDTVSKYSLSGTPGATEYVSSTGTGTCNGTAQASCTIEVVTTESHTGTTTFGTSTAGYQELINAGSTDVFILVPYGTKNIYAPIYTNNHNVFFQGLGVSSTIRLNTPGQVGIYKNTANYLELRSISVIGDTTTTGLYVKGPVANSGADRVVDCFFQNHDKGINHRTVNETWITGTRFYGNETSIETVNEINNDAGNLLVAENEFLSNASSTSKGIWFHGPGGAFFFKNSFLGERDSFYADLTMATVDIDGTDVTATSGRFYSSMVGGSYYFDGNVATIASYIDSTHITIGTNLGTLSGVQFGQSTGQFHFEDNNFDNQYRTGVSFVGKVYFGGINLRGNTFSNFFGTEKYTGISITNPAVDQLLIADNKFGNLAGVTYDNTGIAMTYTGTNLSITGNTFIGHKYAIDLNLAGTTNSTDNNIAANTLLGGGEAGTVGIRLVNALRTAVAANKLANFETGVSISGASSAEVAVSGGQITCTSAGIGVNVAEGTGISVQAVNFGTDCLLGVYGATGTVVSTNGLSGTPTAFVGGVGTVSIANGNANVEVVDNVTAGTTNMNALTHKTTGVAAAGFGIRMPFNLHDAGSNLIVAGGLQIVWEDATVLNRYAQTQILVSKNNVLEIAGYFDKDKNFTGRGDGTFVGRMTSASFGSATNCSSAASPAVCSSAASGSAVIAAAATTVVVNTTAVTANSQILLTVDNSLGTKLGVTCNTTYADVFVSARTAATSFTITTSSAPVTDPRCLTWTIIN